MKRSHLFLSAVVTVLGAAFALTGCKAPTVDYQITSFASLRAMSFATNCGANTNNNVLVSNGKDVPPLDFYWFPKGQSRPAEAGALGVSYGAASVYSTLLIPGLDSVVVTPHLVNSVELNTTITMAAPSATNTGRYTFLLGGSSTGGFQHWLIEDGVPNPAPNLAYVRFINMQPNSPPLTLHVNDPVLGQEINSVPVTYGQVSTYATLGTSLDTSYAFYATNSGGQIISRLAYQTFSGGNCYTIVYAGDECGTLLYNPGDTSFSAEDTIRLRAFDDNSLGSDLTNPVILAYRFNIVNNLVASNPNVPGSGIPQDSLIGFTINGNGFNEFDGFSLPPIPTGMGGGEAPAVADNGAYDVNYQSAVVPKPLVIAGYATDGGSFQSVLFNAGAGETGGVANSLPEGPLLLDSNNNKSWSILFFDTVTANDTNLSTQLNTSSSYSLIRLPDMSIADSIILIFTGATAPNAGVPGGKGKSTYLNTLFYVDNGGTKTSSPRNGTTGMANGSSNSAQLDLPLTSATSLTVFDSLGSQASSRVPGGSQMFTAVPGGIYEIVATGTRANPQILVMKVN